MSEMRRTPLEAWSHAGISAWLLGIEASTVIALRMMKMAAGGPAAQSEARRMVSEKLSAGSALQALALTGGLGPTAESATNKTLAHYRRKVRANKRRLTGRKG
jgi:hypothetical protein